MRMGARVNAPTITSSPEERRLWWLKACGARGLIVPTGQASRFIKRLDGFDPLEYFVLLAGDAAPYLNKRSRWTVSPFDAAMVIAEFPEWCAPPKTAVSSSAAQVHAQRWLKAHAD
jgi:hypothetical protein